MEQTTLINLIKDTKIQVPEIQRDYVQGRDEIGIKSKIVHFTKTLADGVVNFDGKPENSLVLNFVYGNKINDEFLPLDGQQRLTTLYLLHLYVWARAEKEEDTKNWKSFDYQVRPTSNRFFDNLREHLKDLRDDEFLNEKPFADLKIGDEKVTRYEDELNDLSVFLETNCFLVSRPWFKRSWLNDLTVRSAVIALYLIKEAFKSKTTVDYKECCKNLENGAIVFSYLDIAKGIGVKKNLMEKSNEIYVKMNARGKQLTPFENLKAELYERAKISPDFKRKVDAEWLEYFLGNDANLTKETLSKIDDDIMALFHAVAFNRYILSLQKKAKEDADNAKDDIEKVKRRDVLLGKGKRKKNDEEELEEEYHYDLDPVSSFLKRPVRVVRVDDMIPRGLDKKTTLESIAKDFEHLMDFLLGAKIEIKKTIPALFIVGPDGTMGERYHERLMLSSWVKFLNDTKECSHAGKQKRKEYFNQWTRAFGFILDHSEIDKSEKFLNSLNRVNNIKIFKKLDDTTGLYEQFTEDLFNGNEEFGYFDKAQIADEVRKAKKRIINKTWERLIFKFEDNGIFKGQSIFLHGGQINLPKYIEYWKLTEALFTDDSVTGSLAHRLFATKPIGGTPGSGSVISIKYGSKFPSYGFKDEHNNYGWWTIFDKKEYVEHFCGLLEDIEKHKSGDTTKEITDAANKLIEDAKTEFDIGTNDPYDLLRYMMIFDTKTEEQFRKSSFDFEDGSRKVLKGTQKNVGIDVTVAVLMAKHHGTVEWDQKQEPIPVKFDKLKATLTYDGINYKIERNGAWFGRSWQDADNELTKYEKPVATTAGPATSVITTESSDTAGAAEGAEEAEIEETAEI